MDFGGSALTDLAEEAGTARTIDVCDPAALLRRVGLRPTLQRRKLAALVFGSGDRHLTADDLSEEARRAGIHVTLATVYNTLNRFAEADLLRRICVRGHLTYFDTKLGDHAHFYIEKESRFLDTPDGAFAISRLPEPPDGFRISAVEVVVRLRKSAGTEARRMTRS